MGCGSSFLEQGKIYLLDPEVTLEPEAQVETAEETAATVAAEANADVESSGVRS